MESKVPITHPKITILITMRGLLIREKDFLSIPELKNKLQVTHTTKLGKKTFTQTMHLYRRVMFGNSAHYLIARFALQDWTNFVYKNCQSAGEDIDSERFTPGIDLLESQQVTFDHLLQKVYSTRMLKSGFASCIFVMDTGLGKTYMGGAFIEYHRKKTLIIIPKMIAAKTWFDMLTNHFPDLEIGQYHSQAIKTDGDVVLMTINSAIKNQFIWISKVNKQITEIVLPYQKYFEKFGAIIYDEVHNYPTLKRQEIFWRANFQYVLGLTATPDERSNGMDAVTKAHVGPIIRAKDIPGFSVQEIKWKGTVKAISYYGPPEYTQRHVNREGWTDTAKTCEQFIADPYRNTLLLKEIRKLYEAGKHIFVFAERREYLKYLRTKLLQEHLLSLMPEDEEVQTIMGGITREEESDAADRADVILITYGYGMESLSISKMDAIVFATPRRNKMRQTLGRILRRNGDVTITREIIDIIDENTTLKSQFTTRKKVYKEKNFSITQEAVDYTNLTLT
jgi:superfamily II DNA or RNA helicase